MSVCPRCRGMGGAHYAGCLLQNLIERWLGPDYPLSGPSPVAQTQLEYDEIEQHVERATQPLIDQIAAMRAELDAALEAITRPDPTPSGWEEALAAAAAEKVDEPEPEPEPAEQPADGEPTTRSEEDRRKAASDRFKKYDAELRDRALPIVRRVIEERTVPDPDGWLPGYEFAAVVKQYNPDINHRAVGIALGELGYAKRQIRQSNGVAPLHYRGLKWKPEGQEPPLEEQMEKRRQAETAAKAEDPKPERKERYRYSGQRPGQEISAEYRRMLEPLWSIPGWSYAPHNANGGGKPRVTSPAGTSYVIPNTPSDVRAVKNTRAALRRLGAPL